MKTQDYGVIQRGCSLTIPVLIKDSLDSPLDLTGLEIAFTVKKKINDFDMNDSRAYIQKNFQPQLPTEGRFYIQLSSQDTNFETGNFYFDIELTNTEGGVYRLCTLSFNLEGGPTNRTINDGIGQLQIGDEILIVTLEHGTPLIVVAPAIAMETAETKAKFEAMTAQIQSLSGKLEEIQNLLG